MKILDRGYWISKLFVNQSLLYYFFYSIKFRSLLFFSACNPRISFGGMLDERKSDIYKLLPESYYPKTFQAQSLADVKNLLVTQKVNFPFVIKPNVGFKGHQVSILHNILQLENTFNENFDSDYLIQEYSDLEKEYSLMFYKCPKTQLFGISSLVEKSYPFVVGDGKSTVRRLIETMKNPFLKKEELLQIADIDFLDKIPGTNETVLVEKIGNYSRGSKFHSLMEDLSVRLADKTLEYFESINGLDFFRIDFKANNLDEYQKGSFSVLEINGAKSEPLHIYDKKHNLIDVIMSIHKHWMVLIKIVNERRSMTYTFPSTSSGWESFKVAKKIGK